MATRRGFLAGLAALTLPVPSWADVGNPRYLAAGQQGEGFVLHGLSATGATTFAIDLPGRGHAALARRHGTFALVLDCLSGAVTGRLVPPEGRQQAEPRHNATQPDGSDPRWPDHATGGTAAGLVAEFDPPSGGRPAGARRT